MSQSGFVVVASISAENSSGFGVAAMPSGYLVDRKGVVRRVHQGFTAETATALDREVDELLKAAP